MARYTIARLRHEKIEAAFQLRSNGFNLEKTCPACCHFQRKGAAINQLANTLDLRAHGGIHVKVGLNTLSYSSEQVYCLIIHGLIIHNSIDNADFRLPPLLV